MAKKRSHILDQIDRLEIGDSFSFYETDWDLKSTLRAAIASRFLANRHFKIEYRIDGRIRVTRVVRRALNFH